MKGNNLFALCSGRFILMRTDVENEYLFFRTDMQELEYIGNKPIEMYYKFSKKEIFGKNISEDFDITILPDKTKAILIVNQIKIETDNDIKIYHPKTDIDEDVKIYKPKKLGNLK